MKTLVGSPDPPDEGAVGFDLEVDVISEPDAESITPLAPPTPDVIIDHWLDATRHRNMFTSDEVMNMLLDIRNSLSEV